MASLRDHLKQG